MTLPSFFVCFPLLFSAGPNETLVALIEVKAHTLRPIFRYLYSYTSVLGHKEPILGEINWVSTSFNQQSLNTFYGSGTVLWDGDVEMSKSLTPCSQRAV